MKVYGTDSLQPAVLTWDASQSSAPAAVVYVPHANAHGTDEFSFTASDCTGNIFRESEPATISFTLTPVNDAPTTVDQPELWADVGVPLNITLTSADVDGDTLTYSITTLPSIATLKDAAGAAIVEGATWTSATTPYVTLLSTAPADSDAARVLPSLTLPPSIHQTGFEVLGRR